MLKEETKFSVTSKASEQIISLLSFEEGHKYFRISVNGGGCSGFQYEFNIVVKKEDTDYVIACGDYELLIDDVSIAFIKGGQLDFVSNLLEESFEIKNPNAKSSCGCGVSFSV